MCLFSDKIVELFLRNPIISVSVSPLDHLLKNVIVSKLSEILCYFPQILKSNEASFIDIVGHEDFMDLISCLVF